MNEKQLDAMKKEIVKIMKSHMETNSIEAATKHQFWSWYCGKKMAGENFSLEKFFEKRCSKIYQQTKEETGKKFLEEHKELYEMVKDVFDSPVQNKSKK